MSIENEPNEVVKMTKPMVKVDRDRSVFDKPRATGNGRGVKGRTRLQFEKMKKGDVLHVSPSISPSRNMAAIRASVHDWAKFANFKIKTQVDKGMLHIIRLR